VLVTANSTAPVTVMVTSHPDATPRHSLLIDEDVFDVRVVSAGDLTRIVVCSANAVRVFDCDTGMLVWLTAAVPQPRSSVCCAVSRRLFVTSALECCVFVLDMDTAAVLQSSDGVGDTRRPLSLQRLCDGGLAVLCLTHRCRWVQVFRGLNLSLTWLAVAVAQQAAVM
jgi:hypothetical protein